MTKRRAENQPAGRTASEAVREFEGKDLGAGQSLILVNVPTGGGPSLHRHPYEEIFVVHAGNGIITIGETSFDAGPGDVAVAPSGTPHRFVNSGSERLQLTAIHNALQFVTEWLQQPEPSWVTRR